MIVVILFWCFVGICVLHLFYWSIPFGKLAFLNPKVLPQTNCPPVSIIVCAKDEFVNLSSFLPKILEQDYPLFEVLLVDDGSEDGTSKLVKKLAHQYAYFKCLSITEEEKGSRVGKKYPLSKGIEAAKYELLLLTDADCIPASNQWVKSMVSSKSGKKEMVLGFSPYRKMGGWLNRFIRFEAVYTAIQYMGFALVGQPYMGVGRNILYQKEHFKRVDGFSRHEHIASGDDDLLVNAVANKENTVICLVKDSFVYSEPKKTLRGYYRQKTRHLTTGVHYKWQHQMMLGGLSLSHFGFYVLGLGLLCVGYQSKMVLFLLLVISLIKFFFYKKILKKLSQEDLLGYVLLLDALFVFYYLIFIPDLLKGPTNRWK